MTNPNPVAPKTDTPATEIPVKLFMVEGDYHLWDDAEGVYWVRERELNQLKLALSRAESTLAAERASRVQADTEQFNAALEPIGNVRRSLFVDGESKWNGLVRDMTAYLEQPGELVNRAAINEYLREWVAKYMDLTSCPLEIPFPSKPSVSPEQAEETK